MTDLPFLRLPWRHAAVTLLGESRRTVAAIHLLAVVLSNDDRMALFEVIVLSTGAAVLAASFAPIIVMTLAALLGVTAPAAFVAASCPLGLIGKRRACGQHAADKQCQRAVRVE